ncbi:MAG: 3-oxoacyl-[acyl-carrier-protein] reductase [Clostridiales bacterium]|nr:3-oxoacyl-[acyl-carrier-protein] reductase [Clostridiales bacterium]
MFELTGKTAVVTGGSRGIGRAICQKLAAQGANIVLNYAGNEAAAQETERLCRELGAEVLTLRGDVSDPDACTRLVEQTLERFGAIDILVCNAGITRDNLLMRMSDAEFDQVIATNLKGTFNCMRAAVRPMMRKRRGRIISISSVVGVMGNAGQINYAASKAGVIGMTKSLAREVASRGITVNAVAPGFIRTDMTEVLSDGVKEGILRSIPLGELGSAEDVANTVLFLASDEAAYLTGQVIGVDGGMAM